VKVAMAEIASKVSFGMLLVWGLWHEYKRLFRRWPFLRDQVLLLSLLQLVRVLKCGFKASRCEFTKPGCNE
jgi:hypothetical protein